MKAIITDLDRTLLRIGIHMRRLKKMPRQRRGRFLQ